MTTDQKIKLLEKALEEKKTAKMASTYQQTFAGSKTVELFQSKAYNKTRNKELKPADRKAKKEVRPDYGTGS